jgi:uncharacterized protein YcbX
MLDRARVLRTVQHPTLMALDARLESGGILTIAAPTGEQVAGEPRLTNETVTCDYWGRRVPLVLTDGPHAELCSEWLGRVVRLASAPRGGVVFADPVTVVTTGSMRDLAERADHPGLLEEAARFRSTLVVETDEPWVEETWTGREVTVGEVRLRIGLPIPRCAVIDRQPTTGIKDVRLLKTLATSRPVNAAGEPGFGVFAQVVGPGAVAPD